MSDALYDEDLDYRDFMEGMMQEKKASASGKSGVFQRTGWRYRG